MLQGELGSLRGAIGTPEQVRDLCRRYEEAGVDQVIFCLQAGRNRHEHICESLELFGSEVLPGFAARADEADAAREARLGGAIPAALARREPPRRLADRDYAVTPTASGPPAAPDAGGLTLRGPRATALARRLAEAGERAFAAYVRRSGDRRLERTVGTDPGLRALFAAMAHAYVPGSASGFTGELQYELRRNGHVVPWTLRIDGRRAVARSGPTTSAALTVKLSVSDFARIAGGELDPGRALLTGRLDLEGDFSLAQRLGEMFGRPAAL